MRYRLIRNSHRDKYIGLVAAMAKLTKLKTIKPVFSKEEFEDEDDFESCEEDEEQHSKFLNAIQQLDGKKKYRKENK